MNNELEYDYYGVLITTHTKEECTETIKEALIGYIDDFNTIVLSQETVGRGGYLTEREVEVLIDSAYELFSTLPREYDLYSTMVKLIEKVNLWCNNWKFKEYANDLISSKYKYLNSSTKEKGQKLRDHIDGIYALVGKNRLNEDILNSLDLLYKHAEETVFDKKTQVIKTSPTTGSIKEYLRGLHLPNKTEEIDTFMKKLKRENSTKNTH